MPWLTFSIKNAPDFERPPFFLELGNAEVFAHMIEGNLFSEHIEQMVCSQTNGTDMRIQLHIIDIHILGVAKTLVHSG